MEIRQQLEELRSQREVLQSLVKSPGWGVLVEQLRLQATGRARECALRPTYELKDAFRRNVQLGIILGLKLAVAMPKVVADEKYEEIEKLLEEIRSATESDTG